jgi:hypothetical protein
MMSKLGEQENSNHVLVVNGYISEQKKGAASSAAPLQDIAS